MVDVPKSEPVNPPVLIVLPDMVKLPEMLVPLVPAPKDDWICPALFKKLIVPLDTQRSFQALVADPKLNDEVTDPLTFGIRDPLIRIEPDIWVVPVRVPFKTYEEVIDVVAVPNKEPVIPPVTINEPVIACEPVKY